MSKRAEYDKYVSFILQSMYQTPKELRAKIVNGCGPTDNKILSKIIPELIFNNACCIHDFSYFVGGKLKPHKKLADKLFYETMKAAVKKQTYWGRWFYYAAAWTYVQVVSKFGKSSFEKRDRPLLSREIEEAVRRELD